MAGEAIDKSSHRNRFSSQLTSPVIEELDGDAVSIQSSVMSENSQSCIEEDMVESQVPSIQFHLVLGGQAERSSWFAAVFLIINACLGAGLLNFPQAYDLAGGIGVAVVIQGILIIFIFISLVVLAFCSDLNQSATYQDVVFSMCGRRAHQICSFVIALYCYGTCLTFLVIIGDQFDRAFASIYGKTFCHEWYMNRNFTIVVSSILFILPLCFPRRIDFLKYASLMGVFAIVYVVVAIVYEYYFIDHSKVTIRTEPKVWTDVFYVVPVICFGYQCHVSVVPIYSCLKNRTVPNFIKSVVIALIICIATYTFAGIYGYLSFGQSVNSDILESYSSKDAVLMTAMIALAGKTFTTYPILLFCGRTAIDGLWIDLWKMDIIDVASGERKRRITMVSLWFTSSLLLALIIPNISDVIQILGSLAAVFIFVFPGMCLMQANWKKDPDSKHLRTKFLIFIGGLFIVIGAFVFGLVFVQSILLDVQGTSQSKKLCV
ncbi:putative sodium-coupled neutral amino acid transporter 7 [Nymphon striatum]|nr:putative sodium-coupled neutral amino acid transporter 7 [Nymphon striatum]